MIRDRDGYYGQAVTRRLAAMGIPNHPIARSPWQNGHAERLIGSIRRECFNHIVVLSEAHLRRVLAAYAGYYNELRTHLSLGKDPPRHQPVQRLACSPLSRSSADCTMNIAGRSFRQGQLFVPRTVRNRGAAFGRVQSCSVRQAIGRCNIAPSWRPRCSPR
jgi:Integrase core domain